MGGKNLNQISGGLNSNGDEIFLRKNQGNIEPNSIKLSKKMYSDKNITQPTQSELISLINEVNNNPLNVNKGPLVSEYYNPLDEIKVYYNSVKVYTTAAKSIKYEIYEAAKFINKNKYEIAQGLLLVGTGLVIDYALAQAVSRGAIAVANSPLGNAISKISIQGTNYVLRKMKNTAGKIYITLSLAKKPRLVPKRQHHNYLGQKIKKFAQGWENNIYKLEKGVITNYKMLNDGRTIAIVKTVEKGPTSGTYNLMFSKGNGEIMKGVQENGIIGGNFLSFQFKGKNIIFSGVNTLFKGRKKGDVEILFNVLKEIGRKNKLKYIKTVIEKKPHTNKTLMEQGFIPDINPSSTVLTKIYNKKVYYYKPTRAKSKLNKQRWGENEEVTINKFNNIPGKIIPVSTKFKFEL